MYRRNRYYDPQTSQFTQSDPIGIAGGLNAYGFASGDPVSYGDPYGLCPDHLWNEETQTCPGGMTRGEYTKFENLFIMKLSGEAGDGLLEMLEKGMIRVNEPVEEGETRVQAVMTGDFTPSHLRVGPDIWNFGADAAAFLMAHDYGHIVQKARLGLIYGSTSMDLAEWNTLWGAKTDGGPGQAFFNAAQNDANRFACSVTIAQSIVHAEYCR